MQPVQLPDEELPLIERPQTAKPKQNWKSSCSVVIAVCLLVFQVSWLAASFFRG
jgi:hypothetical protein